MATEDGELRLALAVVAQAVADVRHGPPHRRKAAIAAIKAGGLDYWLEIVCLKPHTYECLRTHLQRLIA